MTDPRPSFIDVKAESRARRTSKLSKGTGPGQLVVEIPEVVRYVPNAGPPLAPLTLVLPRDSTAFIIDRILMPPLGNGRDGNPLPKRMTYIVGWRDLPAARLPVSAFDILDYVSPRELEDWELNHELELDGELEKLRVEEEKNESTALADKGRKRRRVKKMVTKKPPTQTNIESATVEEIAVNGSDAATKGNLKPGSLKTMTSEKVRVGGLLDESADVGPSRQLLQELAQEREGQKISERHHGEDGDVLMMEVDTNMGGDVSQPDDVDADMKVDADSDVNMEMDMGSHSMLNAGPDSDNDDDNEGYENDEDKDLKAMAAEMAQEIVLELERRRLTSGNGPFARLALASLPSTPLLQSVVPPIGTSLERGRQHESDQLPEPLREGLNWKLSELPQESVKNAWSELSQGQNLLFRLSDLQPELEPKLDMLESQQQSQLQQQSLSEKDGNSQPQVKSFKQTTVLEALGPTRHIPKHPSSMPIIHKPLMSKPKREYRKISSSTTPRRVNQSRGKSLKHSPQVPIKENGEEVWVVEAIEDDALYDVEGQGLVRYFKVRWAGDWPADQNPSWEPEENISATLVSKYWRQGKKKQVQERTTARVRKKHKLTVARGVSESKQNQQQTKDTKTKTETKANNNKTMKQGKLKFQKEC